jgi:hypothetical protein
VDYLYQIFLGILVYMFVMSKEQILVFVCMVILFKLCMSFGRSVGIVRSRTEATELVFYKCLRVFYIEGIG